jgi:hypothetical protein
MSHAGAAAATSLTGNMTPTDTSFALASAAGWPTGAGGQPFVAVIDPGLVGEEKILCATLTGVTVAVASGGRGFDGTSATSHNAGANVEHVLAAIEVDDDNRHVYAAGDDDHTQYFPVNASRPVTGLATFNAGITDTGPLTQNGTSALGGNTTVTGTLNVSGATGLSSTLTVGANINTTSGGGINAAGGMTAVGDITTSGGMGAVVFTAAGLTGAHINTRFAGSTTSGAPTTGAFQLGDFVIDQTGNVWICTAAGSPGTWVRAGSPHLPPAVTTGGIQSYTDPNADVWIAKPGVYAGAWQRARDVLHSAWHRAGAWNTSAGSFAVFNYDTAETDPYALYVNGVGWTCPIAGLYRPYAQLAFTATAVGQWIQVALNRAGTAFATRISATSAAAGNNLFVAADHLVKANAGDVLTVTQMAGAAVAGLTSTGAVIASLDYLGTG